MNVRAKIHDNQYTMNSHFSDYIIYLYYSTPPVLSDCILRQSGGVAAGSVLPFYVTVVSLTHQPHVRWKNNIIGTYLHCSITRRPIVTGPKGGVALPKANRCLL